MAVDMSHSAIRWAFAQRAISPGARAVLSRLADHHNGETGRCDPSILTLMDDTGYGKDAVQDHLAALEAAGLIVRVKAIGARSSYRLMFAVVLKAAPNDHAEKPPTNHAEKPPTHPSNHAEKPRTPQAEKPRTTTRILPPNHADFPPKPRGNSASKQEEPGKEPGTEPGKTFGAFEGGPPGLFDAPADPPPIVADNVIAIRPGVAVTTQAAPPPAPIALVAQDPPSFEAFWLLYPRKTAKGKAREAWAKAMKGHTASAIIEALRTRLPHFSDEPRFVPHPATWLNQERWNDDIGSLQRVKDSRPISAAEESAYAMGLTPDDLANFLNPERRTKP